MLRDFVLYVGFRVKDWYIKCREAGKFMHWFHKVAVVFALLLWLATAVKVAVNQYREAGQKDIITAFNCNTYNNIEAVISTYGKYGNIDITDTAKKLILQDVAKNIGVEDYTIEDYKDEYSCVKELRKESVNGEVRCRFITVGEVPEADCNQYISMEVRLYSGVESAFAYKEKLEAITQKLDMDSNITVNLKGEIAGKLSDGVASILADTMIGQIDARIVAENRDEELFTLYAYDGDIDSFVKLGNKKVNVNLSIAYDETKDMTCVYLATPINNEDY